MLIIIGPTIHKKNVVQFLKPENKSSSCLQLQFLAIDAFLILMLLGRGMDNKLVMSDVRFHGWNEFLALLPDGFSIVLIHIDVSPFQILSFSQNLCI